MKQVLVHSNKTYLFPLPETYEDLVKHITDKVKSHNIIIYHKNKIVKDIDFNEDLIILDVCFTLKGGLEYPVITTIILNMLIVGIISSSIGTFLIILVTYITSSINGKISMIELIENNFFKKNFNTEVVYASIIYYIFSVIPSLSILYTKNAKCPSFTLSLASYLYCLLPFFSIVAIIIYDKAVGIKKADSPILYCILLSSFILIGQLIIYQTIKLLSDNSTDVAEIYKIPFVGLFAYIILRALLVGNNFGMMSIPMIFILIVFSYIGMVSYYNDAYIKYISSPYSKCS